MRRWLFSIAAFACILFGLLPTGAPVSVWADTPDGGQQPPLSVADCSTAQLDDIVGAYLSTPAPHSRTVRLPADATGYLASILRQRLSQCSETLAGQPGAAAGATSPSAACSPAPTENDVRVLWKHLQLCAALISPPGPASTGVDIKWKLPPVQGSGNRPVIFVIGAGGDPAMIGKLVSSLTVFLDETGYYLAGDSVLIPEPAWSPDIYAAQCAQSPQVEGAIVVQVTAAGSGAADHFFDRKNWSAIEATALYAECEHNHPSSPGVPAYVWVSNMAKSENHYVTLTPLTPLALLLTLGSAYEEFAPARQNAVQSTRMFPNPTPLPKTGRVTQVQTTNTSTLNASSLGTVAGGFLASSISYTNGSAPLTQSPTVDQLTWDTLQSVAYELVKEMNCWQPPPTAIASLSVQDVTGTPRKLPTYNPPPGLGRYSTGSPSAPFCAEPNPPLRNATGGGESIRDILPGSPLPQPS